MVIEGGQSGRKAEVNEENELVVRAIIETELEHASGRLGTAYSWVSTDTDIAVGETRLFSGAAFVVSPRSSHTHGSDNFRNPTEQNLSPCRPLTTPPKNSPQCFEY